MDTACRLYGYSCLSNVEDRVLWVVLQIIVIFDMLCKYPVMQLNMLTISWEVGADLALPGWRACSHAPCAGFWCFVEIFEVQYTYAMYRVAETMGSRGRPCITRRESMFI